MSNRRTDLQRSADKADLQLFRALSTIIEIRKDLSDSKTKEVIDECCSDLRVVRSVIRRMMHPDDVKNTSNGD